MGQFEAFVDAQKYLTVPTEFFLSRLPNVRELCEKIENSVPLPIEYSIEELVVSELKKSHGSATTLSVLASGGADSTFLISILARRFPDAKITAYFGKTANNRIEMKSVDLLCRELDVGVEKISPCLSALENQLIRFTERAKRSPRDVAQPLHNAIVEIIRLSTPNSVIIDGQYADTLMFANPQNLFFDWWKILGGNGIMSMINLFRLSPGKLGFVGIVKSIGCDAASVIIWLCRLENSVRARECIIELLNKHPADLVMQVIFYEVLLSYREADKYLLCPEVISPFNNTTLMIDAWHRKKRYNNLFRRKIPIWDYISSRHPEVYKYVRRRSFEPI